MIDDELAVAAEQIGQRFLAVRPVEHIVLSTFTQGSSRRWRLSASRALVNSFSLASSALRAASHSSLRDDLVCCMCVLLACDHAFGRRHPADAGAARLGQDGDAADAGHVEDRPHQLGAGGLRLFHARIDVVDREIGHPAFRHAVELRAARVGNRPPTGLSPILATQ